MPRSTAPPLSPTWSCSPTAHVFNDLSIPAPSDQATTAAPAPAGSDVVRCRTGAARGQPVPVPGAAHAVSLPPPRVSVVPISQPFSFKDIHSFTHHHGAAAAAAATTTTTTITATTGHRARSFHDIHSPPPSPPTNFFRAVSRRTTSSRRSRLSRRSMASRATLPPPRATSSLNR